jgi:ribonuclease M5
MSKKRINEVIIVEGKTDTNRLHKLFDVDTIETNGSALSIKTINLIKSTAKQRPIILFLDPDGPGEKIRRKLEQHLTKYKQAFIAKPQSFNKKIGIAHASDEEIINALMNVINFDQFKQSIT